jgi:hypothetical protein
LVCTRTECKTRPPRYDEPAGEVASLDLALATGRGPASLSDLGGLGPLVKDGDVA